MDAIKLHFKWADLNFWIFCEIHHGRSEFNDVTPLLKAATELDYLTAWQQAWDETNNYLMEIEKLVARIKDLRNLLPQGTAATETERDGCVEHFGAEVMRMRWRLHAYRKPDFPAIAV
ncbi:MAG: hypothetical protein M1830_008674 [Pleopsidium flavum]|nr:MAG: hypothetical protein M1830_008674 [Pleopsidium flavum]